MKLSRPDLRSLPELFARHGEKVVVTIVGLFALWLVWSGIDALRSLAVKDSQAPEAVDRAASQARAHIDREAQPPADLLPPREALARDIDPWRMPQVPWWTGSSSPWLSIAKPPTLAVLDKPLFEELPKRGKPDVLPLEDLKAVAGVAIIPAVAEPVKPAGGKPRPGRDPLGAGAERMPPEAMPPGDAATQRGRIVPYVVVTGLIPVKKQHEEYRSRFESCGYRDPKRDSPSWCDYEIDRAAIGPDGKESWTRIDLAVVAKKRAAEWGSAAVVGVDQEFLLAPNTEDGRSKASTPIGFCAALPKRLDGTWDLADLHPWVVDRLVAKLEAGGGKPEAVAREPLEDGPGREGPGFDDAEQPQPVPQPAAEQKKEPPEYRLFRFVDTSVEPGKTYRYRVRLKVWNPNHDKNPEKMRPHLEDPTFAVEPKLASRDSKPSAAATVPDTTRILVGPLRRAEIKEMRLKPGTLEVLVFAPSEAAGSFAVRALVADPGVLVDVDEKLNLRNQKDRARGEKIATRRLLVDARGRQEDRRDGPGEKEKGPGAIPEPLDVICLRPDGSFEMASLADSERVIAAYGVTPPPRGTKSESRDAGAGDLLQRPEVPGDPLSRTGGGK